MKVLIGMAVGAFCGWFAGAAYGCWYAVNAADSQVVKWVSVIKGIAKVVNS